MKRRKGNTSAQVRITVLSPVIQVVGSLCNSSETIKFNYRYENIVFK